METTKKERAGKQGKHGKTHLPAQTETTSGAARNTGLSGAPWEDARTGLDDNVIQIGESAARMLRRL